MKDSVYNWLMKEKAASATSLLPWLTENNFPAFFAELLWQRGIQTDDQLATFFEPSLADLHDPYLLHDMAKAVERIQRSIAENHSIVIYGDYDADGITSVTVLKEAIELLGGEPYCYLPDRFKDGYGPNQKTYERLINEQDCQLIITVDNGVSGHEAIAYAQSLGVDVVVTDHHELPAVLPLAYAVVHPRHPAGNYPFGDLAGVGVAFKLATALLEEIPVELLDLVAIGTVADLVSLTAENRVLVKLGLDVLKQSDRLGLQALFQTADLVQGNADEETIGFGIAPRLNAIGRLGDATPGVTLLSTFDEEEATALASLVQQKNSERQEIVKEITAEALAMVDALPKQAIYVLAKVGWHEGVLGIVASRIVEETGRPALVLSIDEATQTAKGSGRSVAQVSLVAALNSVSALFIGYGGHQMAAGMSLAIERLEALQQGLNDYVKAEAIDFAIGSTLAIEGVLPIAAATVTFIQQLSLLAPFGTGNPAPYFLFEQAQVTEVKQIGATKNHLKLQLQQENDVLDCVGFGFGTDLSEVATAEQIDLIGQLSVNEWNGKRRAQAFIKDYQIAGFQLFDCRGKKLIASDYELATTVFVVFEEKYNAELVAAGCQVLLVKNLLDVTTNKGTWQQVVIVDCPLEAGLVRQVVQQLECKRVFLYGESLEQCYLNGMPSREQFGKLFQFIQQYQGVDVRYKLKELAAFLKIEENTLIFMIQVFFELEFVTIEGGVMNKVAEPTSRSLSESKLYQERELKIKAEKFLLYSSAKDLRDWLLQQEEEN